MPPKKKGRIPSGAAPTPPGDPAEHTVEVISRSVEPNAAKDKNISDPWTDEQETSLFKAMIRWKPVGSFSDDVGRGFVLTGTVRHAQAFPYDSDFRTPQKPWL